MKTDIHFWTCLTQFFLEWEIFQTKFLEKIEVHIFMFNVPPPPTQTMPFMRWCEKIL